MVPQFDAFADAVLAETGPAVLVGNSLGAATAVRAAGRNSVSVTALVALDDPLYAQHWLARRARKRPIPPGFWSLLGRAPIPSAMLRGITRRIAPKMLYGVIVHGGCDRIIPVHASRLLHQQLPGSDLVILPRSGHCPQLDNPDEVARIILSLNLADDVEVE